MSRNLLHFELDEDFLCENLVIRYVGSNHYNNEVLPDNHILISERSFQYEEIPVNKSHSLDYAVIFAVGNTEYDFVSTPNGLQLYGNGMSLSAEAYKNALLFHFVLSKLYDRICEATNKILHDDIGDIYAYGAVAFQFEGIFRDRPYYIKQIDKLTQEAFRLKKARPGYIYIVQALVPNNLYKIGLSKTPIKRIESLGVKLPFPIKPIHTFPTNDRYGCEKMLHEKFADKRLNGEWFELSGSDIEYLKHLNYLHVAGVENEYPKQFSGKDLSA